MTPNSSSSEEEDRINLFLHAENVHIFTPPQERHLPVTIVTGFLGAGKTTLLNHILTNKSNLRIAAAINDFASLNIDERLVRSKHGASSREEEIVELSNGCVCCHLLNDLQAAVWKLLQNNDNVDSVNYLVVETSGVSDPFDIIQTLDAKFGKCFRARLDSVVTVVDADQFLHSPDKTESAMAQLKCADVVLINKMDLLATPQDCDLVEQRIRAINNEAVLYPTKHCNVPLSAILDVSIPSSGDGTNNAITHEKTSVPIYVSATGGALRSVSSTAVATNTSTTSHLSADEFVSVAESWSESPLSLAKLQDFICGNDMVRKLARIKGVLWIQGLEQYRCVLHMSGRGRLGFELDGKWSGPPVSEIAFIGKQSVMDAEQLVAAFRECRSDENSAVNVHDNDGLQVLRDSKEFAVLNDSADSGTCGLSFFRLAGSEKFDYTEDEIERDLRIDTDAMNEDLADAVNASVDHDPKAFLAYTEDEHGHTMLCYCGNGEPANNASVLFREAQKVLAAHFRNVQVCKCGK